MAQWTTPGGTVEADVAGVRPGVSCLVDEQDAVRELADVYDQLREQALGPEESLNMVSEAIRKLR